MGVFKAKRPRRLSKGIVGIEAAIVLIAFVVVAAALAFVALNMGFYTTQRSKEVMAAGLAQASSALEVDGTVLAKVDGEALVCAIIPVRLSAGQKDVDLTPGKADIAVWVMGRYAATNLYSDPSQAITKVSEYSIETLCGQAQSADKGVVVIWGPNNNGDNVLQAGEKVLVIVDFSKLTEGGLQPYDVFKVEIKPPIGAALTVERTVPASLAYSIMDLG